MEIEIMTDGHPFWEITIAFAEASSWKAGPYLARMMRSRAFRSSERVIAAVENHAVVGYCTFAEKDELPEECGYTPFIGFVYVDEKHRGKRISEKMIAAACDYGKSSGYGTVYLMSGEHGLYEKYGFEKIGDFKTIYGTTDQLFQKKLS